MYKIEIIEGMGRGLLATRNISKLEIICICELLILSENDTIKVNETELKYYTFKYNDGQDCLVLGDGEIFNHSDIENVGYNLMDFDDRKVMLFFSKRDIISGEQLLINYNDDIKINSEEYIKNKSLV